MFQVTVHMDLYYNAASAGFQRVNKTKIKTFKHWLQVYL